jgi:GNAT superfamily N-acetyltransferase
MNKDDVLDNAVWHAIDGHHHALANRVGSAGRFHRDVAPFGAIRDDSPEAWNDLAELIGPGHRALLFAPALGVPDGWVAEHHIPAHQLVAGDITERRTGFDLVDLGPQDVPEMLELVAETRPGPFSKRTIELGRYLGHRIDGRLVAMGGERLRCPGFTEVSAVCTAPDQRGRGLGAALTLAVTDHIRARGDEAFLHVASDNTTALNLYLALGFTVRRELEAVVLRQDH